jgi:DNA mismatch repair protein MutH
MNTNILNLLSSIRNHFVKDLDPTESISTKRKDYSRAVIDFYLEKKLGLNPINHLRDMGVSLRTTPVQKGGLVSIEPLRLASVSLINLSAETWETSSLNNLLKTLIILPLVVEAKNLGQPYRKIGNVFTWTPNKVEIEGIKSEWEIFKRLTLEGASPNMRGRKSNPLSYPAESDTQYIHMKPHSIKGKFELDLYGNQVRKMAFYLNTSYLRKLVLANQE